VRGAVTPIVRLLIIVVVVDRFFQHQAKNDHEDEGTIGRSDDRTITDHDHDDDRMITAVPASLLFRRPLTLTLALLDLFTIDRTNRFRQS
jgi:hypothetical protein